MTQQLTAVPVAGLTPRGVDGVVLESSFARIRSTLGARLGTAHALLFAEPRRAGDTIAWSTAAAGEAVPIAKADPGRRNRANAQIAKMLADIAALVDRLGPESPAAKQTARLLTAVARMPAPAQVWVVGEQPVIILWTHEPRVAAMVPATTATAGSARGHAAPLAASLAAVVALAVLGWMMLHPLAAATPSPADAARVTALQQQLARLSGIDVGICRIKR